MQAGGKDQFNKFCREKKWQFYKRTSGGRPAAPGAQDWASLSWRRVARNTLEIRLFMCTMYVKL